MSQLVESCGHFGVCAMPVAVQMPVQMPIQIPMLTAECLGYQTAPMNGRLPCACAMLMLLMSAELEESRVQPHL